MVGILQKRLLPILFLLAQLGFGLFFTISTPPFQGPDERNHLYRAYAVAQGEWTPDTEVFPDRRGGFVPRALQEASEKFLHLRWYTNQKTDRRKILTLNETSLSGTDLVFVDYPNTAVYPATVYLPAAAGLWVAERFQLGIWSALLMARTAGLLFWLVAGAIVLLALPAFRVLFFSLLLLPMATFTHSVVSADTVTDGIALLTLAFILRKIFSARPFCLRDLLLLGSLGVLLSSCKIVYAPLLLTALMIPRSQFSHWGGKAVAVMVVGGLTLASMLFWAGNGMEVYLPYAEYSEAHRDGVGLTPESNVLQQRAKIMKQPFRLFKAGIRSLGAAAPMYLPAYIGNFGWLDTPMPGSVVVLAYLWIVGLAWTDRDPKAYFTWKGKMVLFTALLCCYLFLVFSQLLSWEAVGSTVVGTIQGRYLTPIFPLVLLLFAGKGEKNGRLLPLALFGSFALLTFSSNLLWERYYAIPNPDRVNTFICDAERVKGKYFLGQGSRPILLDHWPAGWSGEQARSGIRSAKAWSANSMGMSMHLFQCEPGDSVRAKVWYRGAGGTLALGGGAGEKYYLETASFDSADSADGWQLLELTAILPEAFRDGQHLVIYTYFTGDNPAFFDDLEVEHRRKLQP